MKKYETHQKWKATGDYSSSGKDFLKSPRSNSPEDKTSCQFSFQLMFSATQGVPIPEVLQHTHFFPSFICLFSLFAISPSHVPLHGANWCDFCSLSQLSKQLCMQSVLCFHCIVLFFMTLLLLQVPKTTVNSPLANRHHFISTEQLLLMMPLQSHTIILP